MSASEFYDALAPLYHLVYADWEASIARQAEAHRGLTGSDGAIDGDNGGWRRGVSGSARR